MASEFGDLLGAIQGGLPVNEPVASNCLEHLRLSLCWTAMYLAAPANGDVNVLLKGAYGSAVEAVSLVAFGLIRPATLSLRAHYELSLQYLFYRDHPVEWRGVQTFRHQANLPGVTKKYLKDNFPRFGNRYAELLKVKSRGEDDCYGKLSGVAHGNALNSVSSAVKPADLVETQNIVSQSRLIFAETAECLSDIHVAAYESNWMSLPEIVRQNLASRFGAKSPSTELDF